MVQFVKPLTGAVLIAWIIQLTGLPGSISIMAQSAIFKTGLTNVNIEPPDKPKEFNYDFVVKDLKGNKIDFNSYKGKVVFLNLWATWCRPCRVEMPTIQKLYQKAALNKNIEFVMLSIDQDKDLNKVVKYINARKYSFPTFMPSGSLPEQLKVPSIPTTFVISKEGEILKEKVGTTNFDTSNFLNFLRSEAEK